MRCCGNKDTRDAECVEQCAKGTPSKAQAKKKSPPPRPKRSEKTVKNDDISVISEEPSRHNIYLRHSKSWEHPVPYTFRFPVRVSPFPHVSNFGARTTKSPPFYLQLDHMIAVVWCLFSPDKKDKRHLGISQLQWALYFLRGTKMPNGKYQPDVAIAIRAIEDSLIERYADMSNIVMQTPLSNSCITCDIQHMLPRSKCNKCSSVNLGMTPRRSHRTIPSNLDLSLYGTYRTPRNSQIRQLAPQISSYDTSAHIRSDIIRLKALAATISKDQMMTDSEQDVVIDQLQDWHKERLQKLREEMEKLSRINQVLQ